MRVLVVLALLFVVMCRAEARPGGGSSYRSSSSSSSSRSSSSSSSSSYSSHASSSSASSVGASSSSSIGQTGGHDVEFTWFGFTVGLVGFVLFLVMPILAVRGRRAVWWMFAAPFAVALVGGGVSWIMDFFGAACGLAIGLATQPDSPKPREPWDDAVTASSDQPLSRTIEDLRAVDAGFSRVALLDYVGALYHALYGWIGTTEGNALRVRVDPLELDELARDEAGTRHTQLVLGAVSISSIELAEEQRIVLELEGNFTRERPGKKGERIVQSERWTLARPLTAQSPEPVKLRSLCCANCGAPLSVSELGACTFCGADLQRGGDWRLSRRRVLSTETFTTSGLGETVAEAGNELPTLLAPDLSSQTASIAASERVDATAFVAKLEHDVVAPTFRLMYAAWQDRAWARARPLLTDFLWEAQARWVNAYLAQGLTNRLDDLVLSRIELVRVERDRWFDAVTVRVFASCRDYTVDATGKVVGGDAKRPRRFTEYWTFIRAVASIGNEPAGKTEKCPSCGAPLDRVAQTGICGYCGSKITTGDFGWVLSTITQDEAYRSSL